MIEADFIADLTVALGGSLVDVELTTADFQYAFRKARNTYIQKGNDNRGYNFMAVNVVAGTTEYAAPAGLETVIKVIRPRGGFSTQDPFSMSVFNEIFDIHNMGSANLLSYELYGQLMDDLDRYMVHNIPFIFDKLNNMIKFLKDPGVSEMWFIEGYVTQTDDQYRDILWVFEWALSELKIILGRAYGKFGTLPGPSGEISMDGNSLVQEGRDDQTRLLEDITNHVDGEPIGLPIFIG